MIHRRIGHSFPIIVFLTSYTKHFEFELRSYYLRAVRSKTYISSTLRMRIRYRFIKILNNLTILVKLNQFNPPEEKLLKLLLQGHRWQLILFLKTILGELCTHSLIYINFVLVWTVILFNNLIRFWEFFFGISGIFWEFQREKN